MPDPKPSTPSLGVSQVHVWDVLHRAGLFGAQDKAKEINPQVKFNALSSNYDVNLQSNQMDNFISTKPDLIIQICFHAPIDRSWLFRLTGSRRNLHLANGIISTEGGPFGASKKRFWAGKLTLLLEIEYAALAASIGVGPPEPVGRGI